MLVGTAALLGRRRARPSFRDQQRCLSSCQAHAIADLEPGENDAVQGVRKFLRQYYWLDVSVGNVVPPSVNVSIVHVGACIPLS